MYVSFYLKKGQTEHSLVQLYMILKQSGRFHPGSPK